MKFIYLSNGIYDIDGFKNNISKINANIKNDDKTKPEQNLIIYGGNQINSTNFNVDKESWGKFLFELNLFNSLTEKYVLYGNLDFENNEYITKSNELFVKNNNFVNVPNITYKLVNNSNTLLIFFNNQLKSSTEFNNVLRFILKSEPDLANDIKSIDDLIEVQIDKLSSILKANINASSIIFITQSALVIPNYQSKKLDLKKMNRSIVIFEWINRYFFLLNNKKIIWICGDFYSRNELGKINIIRSDIEKQEQISNLSISQYVIGIKQKSALENFNSNIGEIFTDNFEVGIYGTESKWMFNIKYEIEDINNEFEYLEYHIDLDDNLFNFLPTKKFDKFDEFDEFCEQEKQEKQITEPETILSTSDELTEEGDPYKQKYLKYKKKLYKLRRDKQNKQH